MNPAPPPPTDGSPTKKPSYHLPLPALAMWPVSAALIVWLNQGTRVGNSAYQTGQIIGEIVSLLLIPLLLSWVLWRLSRRSATAATVSFLIVLALLVLGQINSALMRNRAAAQTTKDTVAATSDNAAEKQQLAEALDAFQKWAYGLQRLQARAVNSLQADPFFNLHNQATEKQRAISLRRVENLQAANVAMRGYVMNAEKRLRQELTQRKISESAVEQALAEFMATFGPNYDTMLAIRKTDEELAEHMLAFIEFAAEVEGKWSEDERTGSLFFQNEHTLNRYRRILTAVNETVERQAELQRQLRNRPTPAD